MKKVVFLKQYKYSFDGKFVTDLQIGDIRKLKEQDYDSLLKQEIVRDYIDLEKFELTKVEPVKKIIEEVKETNKKSKKEKSEKRDQ